jgi:hypothetical protein
MRATRLQDYKITRLQDLHRIFVIGGGGGGCVMWVGLGVTGEEKWREV